MAGAAVKTTSISPTRANASGHDQPDLATMKLAQEVADEGGIPCLGNTIALIAEPSIRSYEKGGITLMNDDKEDVTVGYVVGFGPGKWLQNGQRGDMGLKLMDRVAFRARGLMLLQWKSRSIIMMQEDWVFAKLPNTSQASVQ